MVLLLFQFHFSKQVTFEITFATPFQPYSTLEDYSLVAISLTRIQTYKCIVHISTFTSFSSIPIDFINTMNLTATNFTYVSFIHYIVCINYALTDSERKRNSVCCQLSLLSRHSCNSTPHAILLTSFISILRNFPFDLSYSEYLKRLSSPINIICIIYGTITLLNFQYCE